MSQKTLTWDEAFYPEANAILEELCNDVAAESRQVPTASYRTRLGLHVRPGAVFDAEAAVPILHKLAADVLGTGVDLNAYRTWLAAAATRAFTREEYWAPYGGDPMFGPAPAPAPAHPQPKAAAEIPTSAMDFSDIGLFGGKLELYKVWIDYEGPKLFALKSSQFDLYYIVNAVDEDDDNGNWLRFLAVPVNIQLFKAIDEGRLPLRSAFEQVNDQYVIKWQWTGTGWYPEVVPLPATRVPEEWFPLPGATFKAKAASPAPIVLEGVEGQFLADLMAAHIQEAGPLNIAKGAHEALLQKLKGN